MKSAMLAILFLCPLWAQQPDLGHVDFPTSASKKAQTHFIDGVRYLHNFEYRDARAAFVAAREAEPGFAMATWGEAMTHNHPIWNQQDREQAVIALLELAATPQLRAARAPSQREKDYLATVEVLFGEGGKEERDQRYLQAMENLAARYPDDNEAQAFYALAILGNRRGSRDFATYMRAGAVVEEVFAKNPKHPGAAHYLIHSYDDAVHAPLGLRAARVYAEIAPDAPHALHMPSHIFMALGMWDASAKSNVASSAAGQKQGRKNYHALYWLSYGYLQQGRFRESRRLIEEVAAEDSQRSRGTEALMRAAFIQETGQWEGMAFADTFDVDGLKLPAAAAYFMVQGLAALREGKPQKAIVILNQMDGYKPKKASQGDRDIARVMHKQLDALIHDAQGAADRALRLVNDAVAITEEMSLEFGPPTPARPIYEMKGDMLLARNRPAEAVSAFRKALSLNQGRAQALLGLARAERAVGDEAAALEAWSAYRRVRAGADEPPTGSTLPGSW